jgi:hypothetical protein
MVQYNGSSMGDTSLGDTLSLTRAACIEATQGQGGPATVECILTRLTVFEAAILASCQYMYVITHVARLAFSTTDRVQPHPMAGIRGRYLCFWTRPFGHGT